MSEITPFFTIEQNQSALHEFATFTAGSLMRGSSDMERRKILTAMSKICLAMSKNPEEWDANCQFNIKHEGRTFIHRICDLNYQNVDGTIIDKPFISTFRFLCEYCMSHPDDMSEMPHEILYAFRMPDSFMHSDSERAEFNYARFGMPLEILKEMINSDKILSLRGFNEGMKKAEEVINKFNSAIAEVQRLDKTLEEKKQGYNFVGLHDAFRKLEVQKQDALAGIRRRFNWYCFLIIGFPALFLLASVWLHLSAGAKIEYYQIALPAASIELVFIYLFRIALQDRRAVESQIMQLQLRMALCQFVENYAEFAAKLDKVVLAKFENLIFSGISSDSKHVPGAFDGIEQITNLIKQTKNGK